MKHGSEYMIEEYPVNSDTVAGGGFEAIIYPKKPARFHRWEIIEGGQHFCLRSCLVGLQEQLIHKDPGVPLGVIHTYGMRLPNMGKYDRMVLVVQNTSDALAKLRSKVHMVVRRDDVTQRNRV